MKKIISIIALMFVLVFTLSAETKIMQMRNGDRYKVEVNTIKQNRFTPEQYMKIVNDKREWKIDKETSLSEDEIIILFRILNSYQIHNWFDCAFTYEALQYPFDNSDMITVIGNVQDERNARVFAWRRR